MTASAKQQNGVRYERRIIERPRLTRMLDESEARGCESHPCGKSSHVPKTGQQQPHK